MKRCHGMMWRAAVMVAIAAVHAYGQAVTFEASVDRNPAAVGEQCTLSFTLTNAGAGGGRNLRLPDLGKFHIMSGPNQSSSMQIVNGVVSSAVTYSYILQPKETGKFTIGAATIEVGGATYSSSPVSIEIVKGQPQARRGAGQQDDLSGQIGDNLFLRATVDKVRVLQGEQINLTFKLYTRVSVVNYSVDKVSTMLGFWSEEVETPKNIALTTEVVNGKQYRVGVLKRLALFPTQSGTLEISPMEVTTTLQLQSQRSTDPFDAFFRDPFGRQVNYTVKSDPVRMTVDPLPPGAPAEFKGAVGQFGMSVSVDRRTVRTNEPVTLKIVLSGTGNIKLLESPAVEVPPDFEQYTPKVSDNISRTSGKISGSKTFEHLYIPRYPGLKVIQPVSFYYFDVVKREYVKLRSPQLELNVEQGVGPIGPAAAGGMREDVRLLSQDIRFIKIGTPSFLQRGELPYTSLPFLVLVLLPVMGVATAFVLTRRRQAEMLDEAGYRNRRAIKVAQKGLRQADYLLKEKSGSSGEPSNLQRLRFYAEISRALWKYLGDKLGIPQAEMSVDSAAQVLKSKSVDHGLIHALRVVLENCEMARFAPTSHELSTMQKTYDEARRIIIELERTLKSS